MSRLPARLLLALTRGLTFSKGLSLPVLGAALLTTCVALCLPAPGRNRETIITALQGANLQGFERVPPAAEPVLQPGEAGAVCIVDRMIACTFTRTLCIAAVQPLLHQVLDQPDFSHNTVAACCLPLAAEPKVPADGSAGRKLRL